MPEFPGSEHAITSNEAFYLPEFPKDVVIVGGGYIAVEFAGIFAGLGARTTLVYRGDLFFRGFDDSVREFVKAEMEKKHINLLFNNNVAQIDEQADAQGQSRFTLTMADAASELTDLVLYATGRKPKTTGLGLEEAGVALGDNGQVLVNDVLSNQCREYLCNWRRHGSRAVDPGCDRRRHVYRQ